jgi:hypothetical protein
VARHDAEIGAHELGKVGGLWCKRRDPIDYAGG